MRSFVRRMNGYPVLALACALASCGGGSGAGDASPAPNTNTATNTTPATTTATNTNTGTAGVDKFVGTWKFTSGTITVTCPEPIGTLTVAESGNLAITKGATSDLIVTNEQCSLKFSVSAATASALAGQSCTMVGADGTEVDTYNTAVLTTSDGVTAHLSATLTAAISSGGQSVTCTGTESSDLLKL
jgi:hypothetical protein